MTPTSAWVPVHIPNPPPWMRQKEERLKKAQAAAARTHHLQTEAKKQTLMRLLRSPPDSFDGTNAKLAEYMGTSVRTVIRLLKRLEADKAVLVNRFTIKTPAGVYTQRTIKVLTEIN